MIRIRHQAVDMRVPLALISALCLVTAVTASSPKFYADDPLTREPESRDASRAQHSDVGLLYDLTSNLFVTSRLEPSNIRAMNVNTIDEVPDSSWFTNRILPRQVSIEDLVRGPNVGPPPNPERWVLIREKAAGFAPGFTAKDANGETWFLSFDPPGYHEGATAALVVANKVFWALGYNQAETFITTVDPRRVVIDPNATMRRPSGDRTSFTHDDLEEVLERAGRNADGTYRAAAGRLLPGKVLGPFRYDGTRSDDPNDLVEHQHRRELRALRVFGAWTNLTDLKAGNTLDTLVQIDGRSVVRHYLQDVGSTFGMGANGPHDWDEGFEYFYEPHSSQRRLMSLGLMLGPWQRARYTVYPSVGRFESEKFDPVNWRPHSPTRAYMEMRIDDAFWAARRVAAFDDALIRALVHTGRFSDAAAEQHLARILIQRRDKIASAYLTGVNPLVHPRLSVAGDLTFEDAAVAAGVPDVPTAYRASWSQFDNRTGSTRLLGETRGTKDGVKASVELPRSVGDIVQVDVKADASGPPAWQRPVRLYFRRTADAWALIGLDREAGSTDRIEARAGERREW